MRDLVLTDKCQQMVFEELYFNKKVHIYEYHHIIDILNNPEFFSCKLCVHKFNYNLTNKCDETFSLNRTL